MTKDIRSLFCSDRFKHAQHSTVLINVLVRFSKDVDYLDKTLPEFIQDSLLFGAPLISTFVVIIYSVPIFTAVFVPLVILFIIIQVNVLADDVMRLSAYMRTQAFHTTAQMI